MNERLIEQAAHWMMRLQSGEVSPEEREACARWQAADPRHAEVFQRMQGGVRSISQAPLYGLSDGQVIEALNAPSSRRAFLRGSLGALAVLGLGALGTRLALHGLALPGDLYTAVGERQTFSLADGSSLTLDAQSRVRPLDGRGLRFHQGALLLQVRAGNQPFRLDSTAGSLGSLGGRLSLRSLQDGHLQVAALDGPLRLVDGQPLAAGQSARIADGRVLSIGRVVPGDSAWVDGLLEVDDQPLAQVIDALRAYHHGVLQVSREAANLRTSGLFPLDDSPRALSLLERSLPIEVRRFSDYWVRIDARPIASLSREAPRVALRIWPDA